MKISISQKASQPIDATPPLAVSVHEAARLVSVSERTIWNLAKQGKIQSKKSEPELYFCWLQSKSF